MGCWDVYCSLCGLPLNTSPHDNIKIPKWLFKCVILLNNNKNINNAREVSCNVRFYANNKEYDGVSYRYPYSFIVLHMDCVKFINREKNIKLKYSDLPINSELYNQGKNFKYFTFNLDYKPTSNYWEQYFDIEKYVNDGYSLESPLKNTKLGNFIINIFNKLKIKMDRTGPRVSATLYNENDMLIGADNNIWTINKNKWCKVNDLETYNFSTVIEITKNNSVLLRDMYYFFDYRYSDDVRYKKINLVNIPRIGQVSKCGMLLKDINIKATKKLFKIEFIILHTKNNPILKNMIKYNFGLQ